MVAPPVRCGDEQPPARPAPALGEHTESLLREIGYDSARIKALKNSRII
jgi:crotonobetainyl-CoA:carnitine CoA-transferase CaiB-like acyl-CoA transferase